MTSPEHLLTLDRRRLDALVQADAHTLDALLSDDLSYFHTNGMRDSKTSLIESVVSGRRRYLEFRVGLAEVRVHGDTLIVTGELEVRFEARDQAHATQVAFTAVWLEQAGGPRLVAWHGSRTAD